MAYLLRLLLVPLVLYTLYHTLHINMSAQRKLCMIPGN